MAAALVTPETEYETNPIVEEGVSRVLTSPQFARAETQRKLLQYLWQNRHLPLSEYAIATEALGRNSHFDPNTDASIRVHISRLRRKLKDYYAETGEPELLLIPTGTHQLVVRVPEPASPESTQSIPDQPMQQDWQGWLRSHAIAILGGACGLMTVLLVVTTSVIILQNHQLKIAATRQPDQPNSFWKSFLQGDAPVKIVLPTPVFFNFRDHPWLKMRSTQVNKFDEVAKDPQFKSLVDKLGPIGLEQSYTVTWDTLAGIQIARYLDRIGQAKRVSFEVTRDSSLLSLEQANVIVLGTDNTLQPMREYMESMNFILVPGEDRVINSHPEKDEEAEYRRVIEGNPRSADRHVEPSIIALLPGRAPGLKVLMLESRDTSGMVSLLSSNAGSNAVEKIWRSHGAPAFFEMVVMTEMEGNKPIRSWPVTIHPYTKASPSSSL